MSDGLWEVPASRSTAVSKPLPVVEEELQMWQWPWSQLWWGWKFLQLKLLCIFLPLYLAIFGQVQVCNNITIQIDDERSEGLVAPCHVGRHVESLDGSHVLEETVGLVGLVVAGQGLVTESELLQRRPLQTFIEGSRFGCVESVVADVESQMGHGVGASEETPDGSVELDIDFVFGVDYLLPPHAAHETEGEDQKRSEKHSKAVAAGVVGAGLVANHSDVDLGEVVLGSHWNRGRNHHHLLRGTKGVHHVGAHAHLLHSNHLARVGLEQGLARVHRVGRHPLRLHRIVIHHHAASHVGIHCHTHSHRVHVLGGLNGLESFKLSHDCLCAS